MISCLSGFSGESGKISPVSLSGVWKNEYKLAGKIRQGKDFQAEGIAYAKAER